MLEIHINQSIIWLYTSLRFISLDRCQKASCQSRALRRQVLYWDILNNSSTWEFTTGTPLALKDLWKATYQFYFPLLQYSVVSCEVFCKTVHQFWYHSLKVEYTFSVIGGYMRNTLHDQSYTTLVNGFVVGRVESQQIAGQTLSHIQKYLKQRNITPQN